jgi:hypothetical protein
MSELDASLESLGSSSGSYDPPAGVILTEIWSDRLDDS